MRAPVCQKGTELTLSSGGVKLIITAHKIEIQVEKNSDSGRWEIAMAVTDGVFDERNGEFLEVPERFY